MRTKPLTVTGLAGPVVLESAFFANRYSITVGGQPATRIGRGRYVLPTVGGGMVEARVRGGFFDAWPSLEINGVAHRTGPSTPVALRALAWVPVVLLFAGGALGGVIGMLAVAVNMAIARLAWSAAGRALVMIAILAIAVMMWIVAATGLNLAIAAGPRV